VSATAGRYLIGTAKVDAPANPAAVPFTDNDIK
jgi:hypothetical protein